MSIQRVYFVLARCQYFRSCQSAKFCDERATVRSGYFPTRRRLEDWLRGLTNAERRCRNCRRLIATKHFRPRYYDAGALWSYLCDDEHPLDGWWPDGIEAPGGTP